MYWFGLALFLYCGVRLWQLDGPRKVKPERVKFSAPSPPAIRHDAGVLRNVSPPPPLSYLTEVDKLWLSRHLQLASGQF